MTGGAAGLAALLVRGRAADDPMEGTAPPVEQWFLSNIRARGVVSR